MATSDGEMQDRLRDLWGDFGLSPDLLMSEAQDRALEATAAWLEKGKTDPEIAIRAVQALLTDPERIGAQKRPCWAPVRGMLREAWSNAGVASEHTLFAQALLLAAWPEEGRGQLGLADLVGSAWSVMKGRSRQRQAIDQWRARSSNRRKVTRQEDQSEDDDLDDNADSEHAPTIDVFSGVNLSLQPNVLQSLQRSIHNGHDQQSSTLLDAVLKEYRHGIDTLSNSLVRLSEETSECLDRHVAAPRGELDLLWWGQACYCHAMAMSYRRLSRTDGAVALWWAAYEAAGIAVSLEVEPAAAYLVETLHGINQDVFERRPLIRWMEEMHGILRAMGDKAPPVGDRLASLATADALGLPVTWTRIQAARKADLASAGDATAIDLDAEIDRGDWASWIFREILLDVRLQGLRGGS